jgi:hypothetical protein
MTMCCVILPMTCAWRLQNNGVVWATNKMGGGHRLAMQHDGNLVIYNSNNGVVWAANRQGEPRYAIMQNDANLVVYSTSGGAIWASKW